MFARLQLSVPSSIKPNTPCSSRLHQQHLLLSPPQAAKRGDLSAINAVSTASQIRQALRKFPAAKSSTTATLAALQRLAKLHATQAADATPQQEQQQRAKLATELLNQLAPRTNKLSAGSLCRLAFILSQLQQAANVKPLWQAIIRCLIKHSSSSSSSSGGGGCCDDATHTLAVTESATYTAADKQQVVLSADVLPAEAAQLIRALSSWDWDGNVHPMLLPAAVAAVQQNAAETELQVVMLVTVCLARMRYYDAELMQLAADRFVADIQQATTIQQPVAPAIPTQQQQQPQPQLQSQGPANQTRSQQQLQPQQQKRAHNRKRQQRQQDSASAALTSDDLPIISQQLLVDYLWSNACMAHCDAALLTAALQALMANITVYSACDASSESAQRVENKHVVTALKPKLTPLRAWSLAVMLVCLLDKTGAAALPGVSSLPRFSGGTAESEQPSVVGSTGSEELANPSESASRQSTQISSCTLADLPQLVHAVRDVITVLESAAAAAAGFCVNEACTDRQMRNRIGTGGSSRSSNSSSTPKAVNYHPEGLAQLHHARLLIAAAVCAVDRQAAVAAAEQKLQTESAANMDTGMVSVQGAAAAAAAAAAATEAAAAATAIDPGQLAAFRQKCKEAWQQTGQQTSYLQTQVHAALQAAGLQPIMEYAVPLHLPLALGPQLPAVHNSGGGSSSSEWGSVAVDIACMSPAGFVEAMQQQGLVAFLHNTGKQTEASSRRSSGSGSNSTTTTHIMTNKSTSSGDEGGSSSSSRRRRNDVLVAIEVDGPSHVAVNNKQHRLGSTVCRTWLLKQQGWTVFEVPWYEWEADS